MEETTVLIFLSLVMLIGSYLAGSIPLVMSLSESKIQLFSVFGAGLLVGTALAVIIPEGIRSLFPKGVVTSTTTVDDIEDLYSLIGVSLVLGFVVMLLIDQCSTSRSRGNYQPLTEACMPSSDIEVGNAASGAKITATIGLVVHAAVDGVALGAAATTTHTDVEMIVFIAIMLHKAPAAFGLVTFLMHEGVDRKRIRRHLLVFSLAAPLLSLVTYFGIGKFQVITFTFPDIVKQFMLLHVLKKKTLKSAWVEGKETLSSVNATGIAMLFSAGTFLYVATVHVLPELTARVGGAFRVNQLFVLVLGAMLPLILTVGHHH